MFKRFIKTGLLLTGIVVSLSAVIVYFTYPVVPEEFLDVMPADAAAEVQNSLGMPCAQIVFKCGGIRTEAGVSTKQSIWEHRNWLGDLQFQVYYDRNQWVTHTNIEFIWFFEPDMRGLKRNKDSCAYTM